MEEKKRVKSANPKDYLPFLFKGVALSRTPERYADALVNLREALSQMSREQQRKPNSILGRAALSKLLRRMGRVQEAETEEKWLRRTMQSGSAGLSPGELIKLVRDADEGVNYILDHPSMQDFGRGVFDFRGAGNGLFGKGISIVAPQLGEFDPELARRIAAMQIEAATRTEAAARNYPPGFNIGELGRKELTRCGWCNSSKAGVPMSKCSGCKLQPYCSTECQKAAWPSHKPKCKELRAMNAAVAPGDRQQALIKFVEKHSPILGECAFRALEVCIDPSRCLRDVFVVFLRFRPESTRSHTTFEVLLAEPMSFAHFVQYRKMPSVYAAEIRNQIEQAQKDTRNIGGVGSLYTFCVCVDSTDSYMKPFGFWPDVLARMHPGMEYKNTLSERLNKGILLS